MRTFESKNTFIVLQWAIFSCFEPFSRFSSCKTVDSVLSQFLRVEHVVAHEAWPLSLHHGLKYSAIFFPLVRVSLAFPVLPTLKHKSQFHFRTSLPFSIFSTSLWTNLQTPAQTDSSTTTVHQEFHAKPHADLILA